MKAAPIMEMCVVGDNSRSFNRFVRSLVHLVRGDLSVISNEVAYLGDLVGTTHVALAKKRAASIADVLAVVSSLSSSGDPEAVSLSEIAIAVGANQNNDISRAHFVLCNKAALVRCFAAMREVIGEWRTGIAERPNGDVSFMFALDEASVVDVRCSAVGDYVVEARLGDRAALVGSAVDIFLRAQGWRVACVAAQGCSSIEVTIPAAQVFSDTQQVQGVMYG